MRLSRLDLYPILVARETGFANEHVIVRSRPTMGRWAGAR